MEKEKYLEALMAAVVDGEEEDAAQAAQAALDAGLDPLTLVNEAIQKPLEKVGRALEKMSCCWNRRIVNCTMFIQSLFHRLKPFKTLNISKSD